MPKGWPFPDLAKLERACALRGWTREMLAEKTGLSMSAIYRVTTGKPVDVETIERISRAFLDNPPDTATAAFVREDSA